MTIAPPQNGLKKSLAGKAKKLIPMTSEQCEELEGELLSAIQLYLTAQVLHGVINKTTVADMWLRLEHLYITKSLANKIYLKERFYTIRMVEGTLYKLILMSLILL